MTVWRARVGDDGSLRAARGAARRRPPDGLRRHGCAACGERVRPPAASPSTVLRRVFEDDAYADRALRVARRPRSTSATARSRSGSPTARCSAFARSTTRSRRSARRPVRSSTRPCAPRSGSAPTSSRFVDGVPRYAAVNESVELVRRARLERAVPFTNAVLRRLAEGVRDLLAALPEATPGEAALRHSYPDWVAETWWRDLGPDEARALMRAQNEPPETVVRLVRGESTGSRPGRPGRVARRAHRRAGARGGAHLAAEPRLAARRARRRRRARASGCSTSALRRAARRRMLAGEVVAVEVQRGARPRAARRTPPARSADVRSSYADGTRAAARS